MRQVSQLGIALILSRDRQLSQHQAFPIGIIVAVTMTTTSNTGHNVSYYCNYFRL